MKRLLLVSLLVAAPAQAQMFPSPGAQTMPPINGADSRIQTLLYDANQVVRLNVARGFQLSVIFGPDERVENVAVGASDDWQVTLNGRGDALFIKALAASNPTNMTVITDARLYNFELSPAVGPGPDTPFTVRFDYAGAAPASPGQEAMGEGRYRLSGARSLRPNSITDDGTRTVIAWNRDQAMPAVFAIDDQGQEMLVDGTMRDGRYVIDAVHSTLIFRMDRQTARAVRRPVGTR